MAITRGRKKQRSASQQEDPLEKRRWGGPPPPFYVGLLRVRGQPSRVLVDVETFPKLTAAETDHLIDVVTDYLGCIGRDAGLIHGFERSDAERTMDFGKYLVVQRGETWEQHRATFADPPIDRAPVRPRRRRRTKPA